MPRTPAGPGRQQPAGRARCSTSSTTASTTQSTAAVKQLGPEVGADAVLDQVAQAAVRHQRADRGQRDRRDGRDPQPGHDHRQRQRQLDPEQQPARGRTRARWRTRAPRRAPTRSPSSMRGPGWSARRARARSRPSSRLSPVNGHQQREQRQRRDRVDAGADAEDRRLQPREPAGDQRQRERDHDARAATATTVIQMCSTVASTISRLAVLEVLRRRSTRW